MSKIREEPARFDWPEPFVIDIVAERYQDVHDESARMTLARLQAAALRERFAGRSRHAAALRLELIAACAARAIAAERIPRTDAAVLVELTKVAAARFRTSPRLRTELCARLEATLSQQEARQDARQPRPATAIG